MKFQTEGAQKASFLDLHPILCGRLSLRSFSVNKIVSGKFGCRFTCHNALHVFSAGLHARTTHFLSFCTLGSVIKNCSGRAMGPSLYAQRLANVIQKSSGGVSVGCSAQNT